MADNMTPAHYLGLRKLNYRIKLFLEQTRLHHCYTVVTLISNTFVVISTICSEIKVYNATNSQFVTLIFEIMNGNIHRNLGILGTCRHFMLMQCDRIKS